MRKVHKDYSLHAHNTFQVESNADYFSEPSDTDELKAIVEYAIERDLQVLVIGEGSNLLFRNNFKGLVVHPLLMGIEKIDESESELLVKVGAGENWDSFVSYCVENGWYGPENLSLIPGSVGSVPVQNIGAYGREAKDLIEYVEVFDMHSGEISILSNQACEFGYRDSLFKHGMPNRYIVTYVVFRLKTQADFLLNYGNVKEQFEKKETQNLSSLRDTIIEIRQQKLPDHKEYGNAGSFFKNPVIVEAQFEKINAEYVKAPNYPLANGSVKIPAAWLIDQCGWKGKKEGNVGSWPRQPLVLVNYGKATGEQIYQFSEKIASSVSDNFNITLEREVTLIG
jgi:UDP-N-acetylmuramate dehydrogenase